MGDWLRRDKNGRWQIDFHQLPRWASLSIGVAVVALVVLVARMVEPSPPIPPWLGVAVRIGGWIFGSLALFLLIRWIVGRHWK